MVEGKQYKVLMKRKVERDLRKLPSSVQETMDELAADLRELGPIRKEWSNFGALKGRKDEYHCHLSGSYSACWRWEKDSTLIEVFYVGSREGAY